MEPSDTQLPAVITQDETQIARSDTPGTLVVPALIADLGDAAGWRCIEFFTANILNPHTRRAYARACSRFFAWCDQRGLALESGARASAHITDDNPKLPFAIGRDPLARSA
jgi:hypothetical protein